MQAYAEIQISELGLKSRSKKEHYDLLCNEGDIYLPLISDAHHKYISQVLTGDKLYLKWSEVKVCSVPHISGLHTINLLEFGRKEWGIDSYLPEYEYRKLPSRPWLWNVLNTLLGDKLKLFVQEKMKVRVKHVVNRKKLNVMALPEFIDIFQKSNSTSVQKGRSHFLIKACGKRKWGEVEEDDAELLRKTVRENSELTSTIKDLEKKIDWYRS